MSDAVFNLPRATLKLSVPWSAHGFVPPEKWMWEKLADIVTDMVGDEVNGDKNITIDGKLEFFGRPYLAGLIYHKPDYSTGDRGKPEMRFKGYEHGVFGANLKEMAACENCAKDCRTECEQLLVRAMYKLQSKYDGR